MRHHRREEPAEELEAERLRILRELREGNPSHATVRDRLLIDRLDEIESELGR